MSTFEEQRLQMVKQLEYKGIVDSLTLKSIGNIPRHEFVPKEFQKYSYEDTPIPLQGGQSISQPFIVALMCAAAQIDQNSIVLEIGTGSGYGAAVLSRMAKTVYSIERIPELAELAMNNLKKIGISNISVKIGDGSLGWPEKGPFDAIIVTAAAESVPKAFHEQLKVGGRLIIPLGDEFSQSLVRFCKLADGEYSREHLDYVRFVPLL